MKTWIKTNLNKITLALALTGATTGTIGLIIGSIAHHKTNDLTYFRPWLQCALGGFYLRKSKKRPL
ncbi:hypothetical protein [Spiroplasma endosymbiont of Dactylopius coccus]